MANWLIDETGVVWAANSSHLRARLGLATRPLADIATFLVTNLGFVAIEQFGNGLKLRWRPVYVRRDTVAATILFLGDLPSQRVFISSLTPTEFNRLWPNVPSAIDALIELFTSERCADGGHFIAKPRMAPTLGQASKLRHALDAATASQLQYDPASLWSMLQQTVGNRFLMLEPDNQHRRMRIMSIGAGYTKFGQRWTQSAPGTHFEDMPDRSYAQSAARSYWAAFETGIPVVEDIDASVWMPSRGRTAVRYTRLVLPLQVAGRRRILSTSEVTAISPISLELAQK